MIAAVLKGVNELVLEQAPEPEPDATQVVVDVKACGICATDHKAVRGKREVQFPRILGHEIAGVVHRVGSAVTKFAPGDEVIVSPRGYCGLCKWCRMGLHHYCEDTFSTGGDGGDRFLPGGFAELMMTSERNIFPKPASLPFEAACLTEPLAGAWKGTIGYSQMQIGEDVVVIGTGGIGLLCLMVARKAGAGRLIAIDTSAFARASAMKAGATAALDPAAGDIRSQVYDLMPDGPDLVIEAAGPIEAVNMMFALCRRGTRVNLFGITTHEKFALDGGYTHFLETRMDASFSVTPEAMQQAVRLQDRGLIDTSEIISHRFTLDRIVEAMAVMDTAERNKVVITQ